MNTLDTTQSMIDDMFLQKKPRANDVINGLVIEFHKTDNETLKQKIQKHLKDTYNLILNVKYHSDPFNDANIFFDYNIIRNKIKEIKNKPERWSFYCQFSVVGTCYAMIREA